MTPGKKRKLLVAIVVAAPFIAVAIGLSVVIPSVLIIAPFFSCFILILLFSCIRRLCARRKKEEESEEEAQEANIVSLPIEYQYSDEEESEEDEEADITGLLIRYPYQVLKAATDNFKASIGKGGSGSVYRGILGTNGSQCIAVKRIHEAQRRKEFKNEVEALARIQHFNLVRLLGYCLGPTGFRCIVYEFIPNGSLATWIFTGNNTIDKWLTWPIRYQIAIDVGRGLAYLHHDCHFKILHRDVKPDNILLDKEFRARVADFGLSRLLGRDEDDVRTTVKGTAGYLAPEWNLPNGISEKSDVYSYGVVLLELVAGQRNMRVIDDGSDVPKWDFRFPKEAFKKMRVGKVMDMVVRRLAEEEDFKKEELKVLAGVGLLCMQTKPEHRPSMADVVDMLEKRVPVDMPPENRMCIT